jgi:hypothetical protein
VSDGERSRTQKQDMGKNLNRCMMKEMYQKEAMKEICERERGDQIRSVAYIDLSQMFLTGSCLKLFSKSKTGICPLKLSVLTQPSIEFVHSEQSIIPSKNDSPG